MDIMKKMLFMAATAALALASCTSEDALNQAAQKPAEDGAVKFGAYTGRTVTRAVSPTETNKLGNKGFGVFAYEQGTTPISAYLTNTVVPNFFYNQKVNGYKETTLENIVAASGLEDVAAWGYSPVKYFSNNPGALHSFYAYAPHISTLSPTTGNPRLLTNSMYGGPALEYTIDVTGGGAQVDILTADATVDMQKPSIDATIPFHFKHALSSVKFNVQAWVDAMTDKTGACDAAGGDPIEDALLGGDQTTITIKSLKLIGNFAKKGVLRLLDGKWDTSTTSSETIELLSSDVDFDESDAGEQDLTGPIFFIPQDGAEVFKIQIVYDVTTTATDPKNSSTITNTIISEEAFPLAQNTAYEYHLNLGMTTVKFTADVTDWTDADDVEVDLPSNYSYSIVNVATTPSIPVANILADLSPLGTPADGTLAIQTSSATAGHVKRYVESSTSWTDDNTITENIYDSTGKKLYIIATGDVTIEDVATTCATIDDLKNATAGYYEVGGKVYKVD